MIKNYWKKQLKLQNNSRKKGLQGLQVRGPQGEKERQTVVTLFYFGVHNGLWGFKGDFIVIICSQHKKKTFGEKRRLK